MTGGRQLVCVGVRVSPDSLYPALGAGLEDLIGTEPRRESVLCLLGQWAVETGGGRACWNWNLTNIRHVQGDGRDWTIIPSCSEIVAVYDEKTGRPKGTKEVRYTRERNPDKCMFRAFESLEDGTRDYLSTLQRKFPRAWSAMLIGEPNAFALALHDDRFYTASPALYAKNLLWWFRKLDASLPTI